jgi:hypothetical protein
LIKEYSKKEVSDVLISCQISSDKNDILDKAKKVLKVSKSMLMRIAIFELIKNQKLEELIENEEF